MRNSSPRGMRTTLGLSNLPREIDGWTSLWIGMEKAKKIDHRVTAYVCGKRLSSAGVDNETLRSSEMGTCGSQTYLLGIITANDRHSLKYSD
jgi:hypothetical protein